MREQENSKITGKVKWYAVKKAYGFITAPAEQRDYFVYFNDIISEKNFKCLFEDDWVEFEPVNTPKGWKAVKVKIIPTPRTDIVSSIAEGGENDK